MIRNMGTNTNTKPIATFKIASVYAGTVVGAGFASGQEVLQFFSFFGVSSFLAVTLAAILFVFFGFIILDLGHRLKANSYREVIRHAGGRWVGKAIDAVITFFLFGAFTAMIAGAGAIFEEQFAAPYLLGSLVLAVSTLLTVMLGIRGVISVISYITPVLLVFIIGISVATWIYSPLDLAVVNQWADPAQAPVPFWPFSAIVYVSYNLVLGVAVLAPLGKHVKKPANLWSGALFGGISLGLGALAINIALLANIPAVTAYEIPMLSVADRFSPVIQIIFVVILLAAVYTTAVASLYGFSARVIKHRFKLSITGVSILAFGAAQFGFSTLVGLLYPAVGFAGLLMLGGLLYGFIKEQVRKGVR